MRTIVLGLFLTPLVFAQQSLTVTASRSLSVQPDQVVFEVAVYSGMNVGLDDVLALLSGSGLTAANLVDVRSSGTDQSPQLRWEFTLAVPFSKIKDTIATFGALQLKLAANKSGPSLAIFTGGIQVSPGLQASQECPTADLIADARVQAQRMVSGTGLIVGPVLALSEPSEVAPVPPIIYFIEIVGNFLGGFLAGLPQPALVPPTPTLPMNCTITVKFSTLTSQ